MKGYRALPPLPNPLLPEEGEFKDANLLKLSPKFDTGLEHGNL
jgi:hypothetical protein